MEFYCVHVRSIAISLIQLANWPTWWISTQIDRQSKTVNEWTRKKGQKERHLLNGWNISYCFEWKYSYYIWTKMLKMTKMGKKNIVHRLRRSMFFLSILYRLLLNCNSMQSVCLVLYFPVNAKRNPTNLWLQILLLYLVLLFENSIQLSSFHSYVDLIWAPQLNSQFLSIYHYRTGQIE